MPSLKSLNFSDLIDQSRGEENMFDVEFIVLNKDWNAQGTLKAHKYFLAFISPVFRQQFFGALRNDDREVKVPDVSFPAFELMIRWGYTGDMAIIHSIGDSIRSTGSLTVICMYTYSTIELPLLYSTYLCSLAANTKSKICQRGRCSLKVDNVLSRGRLSPDIL